MALEAMIHAIEMENTKMRTFTVAAGLVITLILTISAQGLIGIFENERDLPSMYWPGEPGTAAYNPQTQEYQITSTGAGHRIDTEVSGPFTISAKIRGEGGWKFVFVADDYTPESWLYGVGPMSNLGAWWGRIKGGAYGGTQSQSIPASKNDGRVKLVREGDWIYSYCFDITTQEWTLVHEMSLPLEDPVYVGLGAWIGGGWVTGYYTDVELITEASAVDSWEIYK